MKKMRKRVFRKLLQYSLFSVAIGLNLTACEEDYFHPEEFRSNQNVNVTTYDFLTSRPEIFRLFVEIVDATDYKDSININGATVLVVKNKAVNAFLELNNISSIDEIERDLLKSLMGKYVFRKSLSTEDNIGTVPTKEISVSDYGLHFSLKKDDWKGVQGVGPTVIVVTDLKDEELETDDVTIQVVTTDIKSTTGMLQVFGNDHVFGF